MAGDAVDETEHMREDGPLHPDLAAAKEHLAATNEVLTALGRSASDLDAMLNTVVRSARRLCRADVAQIHLVDGEMYRLADSTGLSDEFLAHMQDHPVEFDRQTLIGRGRCTRHPLRTGLGPPDPCRDRAGRADHLRTIRARTPIRAARRVPDCGARLVRPMRRERLSRQENRATTYALLHHERASLPTDPVPPASSGSTVRQAPSLVTTLGHAKEHERSGLSR
jgi:hypothetical protein